VPLTAWRTRHRLAEGEAQPWLLLFVVVRFIASGVATILLAFGSADVALIVLSAYGFVSTALIASWPRVRRDPVAWVFDSVFVLALVYASGDWRSPFYMLWLTTLALPAVHLRLRHTVWLGIVASIAYLLVAIIGGPRPGTVRPLTSETLVVHLTLPALLIFGLGYATDAMRRLQAERTRRERLAIETERRRIAWELHDSAKQRLHAAHLLVSSLENRVDGDVVPAVQRASIELESAAADMDTSLAELRSPLEGRPLHIALAERAESMAPEGGPAITVHGRAPDLPPLVAAHVYRIGCEALTNALRHAGATAIAVELEPQGAGLRMAIADDGSGLPGNRRPHATGILAMQARAASIGAQLHIGERGTGGGTEVVVEVPPDVHARA
jgi:signal transduction histidine kinase